MIFTIPTSSSATTTLLVIGCFACALAQQPAGPISFDRPDSLAGWTTSGGTSIDAEKHHGDKGSTLKIPPGGRATLKLGDADGSGRVELWVFDDGTIPADPKMSRAGPRWGLTTSDGNVLAVGILYASYLGGSEGYTASSCDGKDWFNQLVWLGINRSPPRWHKWAFDLSADEGLRLFHDDKEVSALDPSKVDLEGFNGIAVWGDNGVVPGETIWVADLTVSKGPPAKPMVKIKIDPYSSEAIARDLAASPAVRMYTRADAPPTPKLEDLPLKNSVSQYGITWTFSQPAHVGQFVNGDWYVVGNATVSKIDPAPLYGGEIPRRELDHLDKERPEAQRVRNGFMVNPPAAMRVAYDSGVRNWFDPALIQKLPAALKPGDSLVSTISMTKGLILKPQLWEAIERGVEDSSPTRTAAILTCVPAPLPADAFRPAFCDRQAKMYFSHDLRRDLLPRLTAPSSTPEPGLYVRFTQRPWVATCFFGFEEPVENMPQYGRDYARVVGLDALLLCTDLKPEQKEPLLVGLVQVGIDLGGMIRAGHPGWEGFGGHGSGRKLPIVFAGLLLGDEQLANINRSFPKAHFGEDEQTAYGDAWTGAKVVFAGHRAIDAATGIARDGTGPYEHTPPSTWREGKEKLSESYRRCCTSAAWIAQALTLHLLKAERQWGHDPFFDYCDRWMYEDETEALKVLKKDAGLDEPDWAHEGKTWETWVNEMWARYRTSAGLPPTDGWKQAHDDRYLRTAIERAAKKAPP